MSDATRLKSAVDELERKLRRLRNNVEGGAITDPVQIGHELRRIMRNELDEVEQLARRFN